MRLTFVVVALSVLAVACSDDANTPDATTEVPVFPADYAATFQEVRNCRNSIDHDLMRIRVLASPDAVASYTNRNAEFPVGAIFLKEEYDGGDTDCSGPITRFSVAQKLEAGAAPELFDFTWQRVDTERRVVTEDVKRCWNCHSMCGQPPEGYLGTCAVP
jgi:hypothetical protein